MPALSKSSEDVDVQVFSPELRIDPELSAYEIQLLRTHAGYGCISLACGIRDGSYPFIFAPYRKHGLAYARLIYCCSLDDFVRLAGNLGRFLARRGFFFVLLDSNSPIEGLIGRYVDERPKYYTGPDRPRLGDLAYSELAMFRVAGNWLWSDWPYLPIGSPLGLRERAQNVKRRANSRLRYADGNAADSSDDHQLPSMVVSPNWWKSNRSVMAVERFYQQPTTQPPLIYYWRRVPANRPAGVV